MKLYTWNHTQTINTVEELENFVAENEPPSLTTSLADFQTLSGVHNNSVQRLIAHYVAPRDGVYVFYASCSGFCQFFLSSNEGHAITDVTTTVTNRDGPSFSDYWERFV